jgi:ATP-dependent Clp protease ATP-binding subunit ClpC
MPETTLDQLIEELGNLDTADKMTARFDPIVAELLNHLDSLGDRVTKLSKSLRYQHRCAAASVYGVRRHEKDIPTLVSLLHDANPVVARYAADAFRSFPRAEAIPALVARLTATDVELRVAALRALGRIGPGKEVEALLPALVDGDWRVRAEAAKALEGSRDLRVFEPLCRLLDEDDDDVRKAAEATLAVWMRDHAELETAVASLADDTVKKLSSYFEEERSAGMAPLQKALGSRAKATFDIAELAPFGKVVGGAGDPPPVGATFERDDVVDKMLEQLARAGNRSFVLVGESGVGKTQLVYELARRAAPMWTLLETSTSEVMVGTKYIGEWETKLRDLVGKTKSPRRVLLYLTNINNLGNAGRTSNNEGNFASLMGSYIRRGEVTVIGETTPKGLQVGLEKDGALKRLFHYIQVGEPDAAAAMRILRHQVEELSQKSRVELVVPQESLDLVTDLARTYFSGMAEPGRSITLLGQVVEHRLAENREPVVELTPDDVVAGLAHSTGLPERLLSDRRPLEPNEVRGFFEERVLGQREASDAMTDLITLVKAGLTEPGKPLGVLFFVGPTGVGKTEIAKALAEYIFGSPDRMVRIDMSEYKDYESFEKLIGGTYRREEGGYLTGKIREQPFSVVLLDEFEKAHPNIFDLFLQVFDDGRLTDGKGVTTDFRQTIIIMTSNLASQIGSGGLGFGSGGDDVPSEDKVLREMRRFFRPEFLNRLGKVVVFKPLSPEVMRKIVQRELGRVVLRSGILRRKLLVDIDPAVVDLLMAEGFSQAFGARPLKRRVEQLVLLPLAREIVGLHPEERGALLRVLVEDDQVIVRRRKSREVARAERVRVPREDGEGEVAVRIADLPQLLESLRARVEALASRVEAQGLAEQRSTIVAETSAPSFWDDAATARRRLAELVHVEELLEAETRLRGKLDDLDGFARATQRDGGRSAGMKSRFESACHALLAELAEVEHRFFSADATDRRDAFLWLRRIGVDKEGGGALEEIERMYGAWSERRGVRLTQVHGRRDDLGPLESIWLAEGAGLFGLLRGEDGLHQFEQGGKGADRRHHFVRVQVIARADDGEPLGKKDVRLDRHTRGGRVEATALHLPTGITIDASAPTPGDGLDVLATDLLAARVANRTGNADVDRVVRRYGVEGRFAHDEDTGLRVPQRDLFAGSGLDEILRERITA